MYDTGLEVSKVKGGHQMKVVDQRDSDSEGMVSPFSIEGVEGIHKHPTTGKLEMAGLYSREESNDQTIPLNHEAEKLHEELQAVSEAYDVKLLENDHVQEAKANWAKAIGESDKTSIRKKWATARKELKDKHVWCFIKQSGNGIWKACLQDSFGDPGEDYSEDAS
jgi:hypothetical protein